MIKTLTLLVALFMATTANATITLPKIFTSNMVLQRDKPLHVWGWADKGEAITVEFNGQKLKTKTDKNGNWSVVLKPMAFGGPFELKVNGKAQQISLTNVLIGDVWLCSGQSNMEWIIKNTNNAKVEIAESNYPKIRLFTVPKAMSTDPEKDLPGGEWLECNPTTVGDFSAVGYFFGRKLNQELNVPIGLLNSSWGGTFIQAWMSWDLMSQKPIYKNVNPKAIKQSEEEVSKKKKKFEESLKNEKGVLEKWYAVDSKIDGWKKMKLPQLWDGTEVGNADGVIWFKKEVDIPASFIGKKALLNLGPIDDQDETYVNGKLVGTTKMYNENRAYQLEATTLKAGVNTIVVRVFDGGGGGGIYGTPEQLYIEIENKQISLAGDWQYKPSVTTTEFGIQNAGPNAYPSQLYNAMIAPVVRFPIQGCIWYQGETNTWEGRRYQKLFPEMITNWRTKWGYEFPFLWVQLANFQAVDQQPTDSDWAELREAQSMTLALPKTGQAVIIDVGEEKDIHPRDKQTVGLRLALAALKVAYDKDIVYSGPVYKSMEKQRNKLVLSFSNVGSGLQLKDKYGYVRGFAIAGADQKFVWAKGYLDGDKVVVYHDSIADPVAVRYAWGNNPDDANLYNKEGLPASPFRTDNWKGITYGD